MTVDNIRKIIMSIPSKSCESDAVPRCLLKRILDKVAGVITSIINISLEQGVFAHSWKSATVRPLLKEVGLELTCSNYRPVSNLPFLSKVTEKCMLSQFTAHCDTNKLLPNYQSAYHKNFSCETALVKLMEDILWSIKQQKITAVVAIDLSATFDTVDHDILLDVLQSGFGVKVIALHRFDSYLRPRSLKVNVDMVYSADQPIDFSIPQGWGAGPGMYSAYASTVKTVVPTNIKIHGYADDHMLKMSFNGASRYDEHDTIQALTDITTVV